MSLLIFGIAFLILIFIATPIAFSMGASATIALIFQGNVPLVVIVQKLFAGMDSLPMLAIPFFMLAGALMETGGISKRLVSFAYVLVGHLKGGIGMVTVLSSMIFAGVSGSSTADTTAVGSLMMPAMTKKGYPKGFVAALQACSGTIGPIIPPSIIMIIYASITGLSVGKMFLAGIIPGVIVGIGLMIACYIIAVKEKIPRENHVASLKEIGRKFWDAILALFMPVIIVGGILGGIFTATEAGMVAVLYGLFVSIFVYKELTLKDLPKLFIEAAKTSSAMMIIAGMAMITSWLLASNQFPQFLVNFLSSISSNPSVVLFMIIVMFLLLGCVVETVAATVIFVPVLQSLVISYGYDPIHFALVIIVALLIGQVTPPVGVLLSLTSKMTNIRLHETFRFLPLLLGVMIIALFIVAYFPGIVMFFPNLFS